MRTTLSWRNNAMFGVPWIFLQHTVLQSQRSFKDIHSYFPAHFRVTLNTVFLNTSSDHGDTHIDAYDNVFVLRAETFWDLTHWSLMRPQTLVSVMRHSKRQWTGSFVRVMAWHREQAPSHYLNQCWPIDHWDFESKYKFSRKCIWKYCLQNGGHFAQASIC